MNISGLLQSKREALRVSLTLHEIRSVHDSKNRPNIEFNSKKNIFQEYHQSVKVGIHM